MKKTFSVAMNAFLVISVIAIILGVYLVMSPTLSVKTASVLFSIYAIVYGILLIIFDIKLIKAKIPFEGIVGGVLSILVGLSLLCKTEIIATIFSVVIGIWIASISFNKIKFALAIKKKGSPWGFMLFISIIDFIIGLLILLDPFEATISMTVFAGIMLLVHSIINIIEIIILKSDSIIIEGLLEVKETKEKKNIKSIKSKKTSIKVKKDNKKKVK